MKFVDITLLDPPGSIFHKAIFLIEIAKITGSGDNELLKSAELEGKTFGKNQIVWNEQILWGLSGLRNRPFNTLNSPFKKLRRRGRVHH